MEGSAVPRPMRKSAIYSYHVQEGAALAFLHDWYHPIRYQFSSVEQAQAAESAALVDISPVLKLDLVGPGRPAQQGDKFPQVESMAVGDLQTYQTVAFARLSEDRLFVRATPESEDAFHHGRVNSFGVREVIVFDVSAQYAALALIGPQSDQILSHLTTLDLNLLRPTGAAAGQLGQVSGRLLRFVSSRYTAVYELYVARSLGEYLWELVLDVGRDYGLNPAGFAVWQRAFEEA